VRGDDAPDFGGGRQGPEIDPWSEALAAAAALAVDPSGLGGAVLRARAGPARDAWLAEFARMAGRPVLRLPPALEDDRLYGGIDLAATLAAGRPVRQAGVADEAEGRTLVLPMAERCGAGLAARLGQMLDAGRDVVLVALDEGAEAGEAAPAALGDRLAFRPGLGGVGLRDLGVTAPWSAAAVRAARATLGRVAVPEAAAARLVALAAMLGVGSLRAPLLALRAARALAALEGAAEVGPEAEAMAARLVLGPRAERLPAMEEPAEEEAPPEAPAPDEAERGEDEEEARDDRVPDEVLVEAARAALPPDVIARLMAGAARERRRRAAGAGADEIGFRRGRPAGTIAGRPRDGARVAVVDTLRAAAPWQGVRRAAGAGAGAGAGAEAGRVLVRPGDMRLKRYRRRAERVVIFVVDASGSTALARLGEAKGAIELMLGQAYVGREGVALVAFRGAGAEVLLPPTKSLVMAKRRLAGLPGGGGTPLAAGLVEGLALARLAEAKGMVPRLALLTDGRANVARDGAPGRERAEAEAREAAGAVRSAGVAAVVIDTGQRPSAPARALAAAMGAEYLPLPRADARALSGVLGGAGGRG
jgi:magnesium chelatase subunit D